MRQWEVVLTITDKFSEPLSRDEILETLGFDTPEYITVQVNSVTQSK